MVRDLPAFRNADSIFCYVSVREEIDTRAIIKEAWRLGKTVGVPLTAPQGEMSPRVIRSFDELRPAALGLLEPSPDAPEMKHIDLCIVPCLCASRNGGRIGYGGGYYDRFLEKFNGKTVLLCRADMLFDALPQDAYDRTCGIIVTERETIYAKKDRV